MEKQRKAISAMKYLLKKKGMKIGELERHLGVTPGYFSRCTGKKKISLVLMIMVADYLNVSIEKLLDDDFEIKAIDAEIAELELKKAEILSKRR